MNYLRIVRHISIFLLPIAIFVLLFFEGIIYFLKVSPETSQLNLLPLCLVFSFAYVAWIKGTKKWIKFIFTFIALGLLCISFDEKLHEDIVPYKNSNDMITIHNIHIKAITDNLKQYKIIKGLDDEFEIDKFRSIEEFIILDKNIDAFANLQNEPIIRLFAAAYKEINKVAFIKSHKDIENDPELGKKVSMLLNSYEPINNYYEIEIENIRLDHFIQTSLSLGVMSNKKINSIYKIVRDIEQNPSLLLQKGYDEIPTNYVTSVIIKFFKSAKDASFTIAGIKVLKNIYNNKKQYFDAVEAYEKGHYDEYERELLKKHEIKLESE